MVQFIASSTGRKLRSVPEDMVRRVCEQIEGERQQSVLHFDALKRILDREQPGWTGHR
jgi:hypothetical protein